MNFLDDVIKDYETYAALVKEQKKTLAFVKNLPKRKKHHKHLRLLVQLRKNSHATTEFLISSNDSFGKRSFGKQIVDRDY